MRELSRDVVQALTRAKAALCTVESCTGGLIAHRITSIAGASAVFWGSLVTYDNSAKIQLADIPATLLQDHGAVSAEVARALAEGGLMKMKTALDSPASSIRDPKLLLSVSVSGIAGPTGGTAGKPVGLCHLALATLGRETRLIEFRGDPSFPREQLIQHFSDQALQLLRQALEP